MRTAVPGKSRVARTDRATLRAPQAVPPFTSSAPARALATRQSPSHTRLSCMPPAVAAAAPVMLQEPTEIVTEVDPRGLQRLKYQPQGWNFWEWEGKRIHYVVSGPEEAPPVVLVHGYGASAYHWRYTVPALADRYRVYAVDMLGFGWSQKATDVEYSGGRVWSRQLSSFIQEVVGGGPVVLAGNSLGGYASLATAANYPESVRAVALLNSAGPFAPAGYDITAPPPPAPPAPWWAPLQETVSNAIRKTALYFAFLQARQPARIKQVLDMVYVSKDSVDEDLVASIQAPAQDPTASQVFFLVNNQGKAPPVYLESLFSKLQDVPVLLLWGDLDPWMTPSRAQKIMDIYPAATKVSLQSGHCPHDDTPEETNTALLAWLDKLNA